MSFNFEYFSRFLKNAFVGIIDNFVLPVLAERLNTDAGSIEDGDRRLEKTSNRYKIFLNSANIFASNHYVLDALGALKDSFSWDL